MFVACVFVSACLDVFLFVGFGSVLMVGLRIERAALGNYVAFSVVSPCFNIRPGGLGNFRNSLYFSVLSWLYPGVGAHSLPSWY